MENNPENDTGSIQIMPWVDGVRHSESSITFEDEAACAWNPSWDLSIIKETTHCRFWHGKETKQSGGKPQCYNTLNWLSKSCENIHDKSVWTYLTIINNDATILHNKLNITHTYIENNPEWSHVKVTASPAAQESRHDNNNSRNASP
jgi:hypothetical protein